MRVGLFTESYEPVINGVATSVKTLATELAAAGHEPIVIAPRFPGHDDADSAFAVLRLPSWRASWRYRGRIVGNPDMPLVYPPLPFGILPAALRGVRFDIVHTQHPFTMGMHARRVARAQGVPLIATFHTLYTEYSHYLPLPRHLAVAAISASLRNFYRACDAIIVPSAEAGRRLKGVGVESSRLCVVPTGIPAARIVTTEEIAAVRRQCALPENSPVILYVGRLAREKNLDLLIDAFAALPERNSLLLLVGSGQYAAEIRARIEAAGIAERTRLAGFVPHEDLPPLYAAATVFAFPSGTETQGLAIAEAQSYGLPCVVVGAGGAPESVRDGIDALIVPPDTDAFRDALRNLLNDSTRRETMSAAARDDPLRLTPQGMTQRIIALYNAQRGTA